MGTSELPACCRKTGAAPQQHSLTSTLHMRAAWSSWSVLHNMQCGSRPKHCILAMPCAAKRHWRGSSCLKSSLPANYHNTVCRDAARWTVLLIFGRREKDLTDFQLALQYINYVSVWSVWQQEYLIARVQMRWPKAPVLIRTRGAVQHTQECLQGHTCWRKLSLQAWWRGSPEWG